MYRLVVLVALVAAWVGLGAAGLLGALTGAMAALTVGSALAIARGGAGVGLGVTTSQRLRQRIGGIAAVGGAALGVLYGGWQWGWALAVPGLFVGLLVAAALASWHRHDAEKEEGVKEPGLPDLDLCNIEHVRLVDEIRERYSALLMQQNGDYARCLFKPASMLPFPKSDILRALEALLGFAEGRLPSPHVSSSLRGPAVGNVIRGSIVALGDFIDVPSTELPRDSMANNMYGTVFLDELANGGTTAEARSRASAAVASLRRLVDRVQVDQT